MPRGHFALLLHAHLPFVRHPEHDDFLEEDWLFEALVETYLPLLAMLSRFSAEQIPVRLTFSVTATLCAMLNDPLLRSRAERYMERGAELARREAAKPGVDPAWRELSEFYQHRYETALNAYRREWNRDVVGALAQFQEEGLIELAACAATHGFLPLMQSVPEAIHAQIQIGVDEHRRNFGRAPVGIWLPECAYLPGLEEELKAANLHWFVLDSHGVMLGQPRPRFAIFAPYFTQAGPACLARDRDSSRQVWSARDGYPGDPAYRDFYRDLGRDLPVEEVQAVYGADNASRFTGLKYHRITGAGLPKEPYVRAWAMAAADAHAGDFLRSRMAQFQELSGQLPVEPLVMAPFDAELFGHWWFEGPEFLDLFLRKAVFDQQDFQLCTPTDFLRGHPTQQVLQPSASSWGNRGYWEVWLDQSNHWIYPHLHEAARSMVRLARRYAIRELQQDEERCLRQLVRELLLAQSSDWAFLMKTGTAGDYPASRTRSHLANFQKLAASLENDGAVDVEFLLECEGRNNLFPEVEWRYYC